MLVEKNKTPLTMHSPTLTHHRGGRWQIGDSNIPPLRLYQVWKGRNKFIFGGRLIFGPDFSSLFITSSLIMVPLILFWAFVAKGLINTFPHRWGVLIIVLSVIFATYIIIPLFLTSGRDPGIIPRNTHPPDPDDCDSSSLSTDWAGSQNSVPGLPMTKSVMINGIVVKVKYCQTCMLYRPPRCSHCSICNNCVERFDHHCPWVGQCIGKRNYRYFFMFVSSTTLLCLYVLASCLINIKRIMNMDNCSIWRAIEKSPVSGILVMYTFVVCWFVGGLTAFHLYLIATNQTTYENFRYQYDQKMNPYNLGCSGNFKEVFFSKIPSSRNKFRAEAKENSSPSFIDSSYLGQTSPAMPKKDFDVETGKQQAIDADDSEDVRNRIGSFGRLERCGTFPRHDEWDQRDEITPDKYMFALELETKPCTKDKEKTNVDP